MAPMQIIVVAGFVVVMALSPVPGEASPVGPGWLPPALALAYVAVAWAATRVNAGVGLRRLMRSPGAARPLGRAPLLLALAVQVYLIAALAALMLLGWGRFVDNALGLARVPLVGRLVALAPFVAALLAHWWAIYPLEQALRLHRHQDRAWAGEPAPRTWTRRQYVAFNVRHHLLFVAAPVSIIILIVEVLEMLSAAERIPPAAAGALALGGAAAVFVTAPGMIVRIWRTRPLPAGALRLRLEGACRRFGLNYRNILIWDTGGVVVNAGVMGVVGPMRYVLLSDALLEHLDPDAVACVFAHEAGHVVHRHIPYLVAFTAGLLLVCVAGVRVLAAALKLPAGAAELPALLVTAAVWGALFGLLSRRFERQADVFSAWAASGANPGQPALTPEGVHTFARALDAVARLNGIGPQKRNYRHGSIARRVATVWALLEAGAGPAAVDRRIGRIKLALWGLLAIGLAVGLLWILRHGGDAQPTDRGPAAVHVVSALADPTRAPRAPRPRASPCDSDGHSNSLTVCDHEFPPSSHAPAP